MKKIRKICLVLAIICFAIAGSRIVYNVINNNQIDNIKNTKVNYEEQIETISKIDKIGINTNFNIIDKYTLCNHVITENIPIDKTVINKNYDDISQMYPDYMINTFNQNEVELEKSINEFCPYHYLLIEENDKVSVYREIDENSKDLVEILDIDIGTLRQADRYMFQTTGIKIYGKNELYQLIEDFDS